MADFNIFGAKPSSNLEELYKMGLLGNQNDSSNFQDFTRKANRQSNVQGLLTGVLSYLAQPKNQNFGSALPYFARAGLQGVQAAGSSMDRYEQDAMKALQLKEQARVVNERNKTQTVIDAMIENNPELAYLKGAPLAIQTTAINEDLKNKFKPEPGLNISKLNPKDFTAESWKKYTKTGDTTVLDGITKKGQADIDLINARLKYEYGVGESGINNNNINNSNVEAEEGFRFGNNNIPNNPNNVKLSNGDVVTPRLYKPMGDKMRLPLQAEKNQVGSQNKNNIDLMRAHRNLIRKFIASGGHLSVTGIIDANTPALTGGKKANARNNLFTIVQKEFLNNYSAVKATGGGFGALSEREGERLEKMGFNLSTDQSPEQLLENLILLDQSLAKSEARLIDGYLMEYGQMEGFNPLELQGFDNTPDDISDDDALVNKYLNLKL